VTRTRSKSIDPKLEITAHSESIAQQDGDVFETTASVVDLDGCEWCAAPARFT
jgi:hypothetical protein